MFYNQGAKINDVRKFVNIDELKNLTMEGVKKTLTDKDWFETNRNVFHASVIDRSKSRFFFGQEAIEMFFNEDFDTEETRGRDSILSCSYGFFKALLAWKEFYEAAIVEVTNEYALSSKCKVYIPIEFVAKHWRMLAATTRSHLYNEDPNNHDKDFLFNEVYPCDTVLWQLDDDVGFKFNSLRDQMNLKYHMQCSIITFLVMFTDDLNNCQGYDQLYKYMSKKILVEEKDWINGIKKDYLKEATLMYVPLWQELIDMGFRTSTKTRVPIILVTQEKSTMTKYKSGYDCGIVYSL